MTATTPAMYSRTHYAGHATHPDIEQMIERHQARVQAELQPPEPVTAHRRNGKTRDWPDIATAARHYGTISSSILRAIHTGGIAAGVAWTRPGCPLVRLQRRTKGGRGLEQLDAANGLVIAWWPNCQAASDGTGIARSTIQLAIDGGYATRSGHLWRWAQRKDVQRDERGNS